MKSIIIIAMLAFCLPGFSQNSTLIRSLIQVESRGNDKAFNKSELACGCLQIRPILIKDLNRLGYTYTRQDSFSRKKSIEMCRQYLSHYGSHYKSVTGKEPTAEIYSRIWNGGPNGWRKAATEKYWVKVRAEYNRRRRLGRK